MGFALVGALGAPVTNNLASITPSFGQATSAGDLLIAWLFTNSGSTTNPFSPPAGWLMGPVGGTQFAWATFFYRENCGAGETPPALTIAGGASFNAAMAGEFSGGALASSLDQTSVAHAAPMPSATMAAADAAAGDLLIYAAGFNGNNGPTTLTTTMADSSGAAVTVHQADNKTTTGGLYYDFCWGIAGATLGASGDTALATLGVFAAGSASFGSFKAAGGAPPVVTPRLLMASFP